MLTKEPKLLLNDDKAGKPEGIHLIIGRRPVAAFGNSIGDKQMLEYTQAGDGARLMMLVHHDDAAREYAYGPKSKIGTFSDELMAQSKKQGWVVISATASGWLSLRPRARRRRATSAAVKIKSFSCSRGVRCIVGLVPRSLNWGPRNGPQTPARLARPGRPVALLDFPSCPRRRDDAAALPPSAHRYSRGQPRHHWRSSRRTRPVPRRTQDTARQTAPPDTARS